MAFKREREWEIELGQHIENEIAQVLKQNRENSNPGFLD